MRLVILSVPIVYELILDGHILGTVLTTQQSITGRLRRALHIQSIISHPAETESGQCPKYISESHLH